MSSFSEPAYQDVKYLLSRPWTRFRQRNFVAHKKSTALASASRTVTPRKHTRSDTCYRPKQCVLRTRRPEPHAAFGKVLASIPPVKTQTAHLNEGLIAHRVCRMAACTPKDHCATAILEKRGNCLADAFTVVHLPGPPKCPK